MIVTPVTVNAIKGVVAPTAPPNVIVPAVVPLFKVKFSCPLIVLEKLMFAPVVVPPVVVSKVQLPVVKPTEPVIEIFDCAVVRVIPARVACPLIPIVPEVGVEVVILPSTMLTPT